MNLDEAEMLARKAVEQQPQNESFLDTLGWIFFKQGKPEEAVVQLEKAVLLKKNSPVIFDHLGDVYFKLDNAEKTKECWKKALGLADKNKELKLKIEKKLLDINKQ